MKCKYCEGTGCAIDMTCFKCKGTGVIEDDEI